jgi:hypothetical protein
VNERESNEIAVDPDTGLPAEEIAWHLAVSPAVRQTLTGDAIAAVFGRFLADEGDDEPDGDGRIVLAPRQVDGTPVRIVWRVDGGYSMTLAEKD